jgi:putative transposase
LGSKRHIIVDQNGVPLALVVSGANVHDSKEHDHGWDSLVVARPRPAVLEQHACEDKGYDFPVCRRKLAKKGYVVHIPYRGLGMEANPMKRHPSRRWVVESRSTTRLSFSSANAVICFRMTRSWN